MPFLWISKGFDEFILVVCFFLKKDNFPLLAGTLASMLHVISGPDHLAAVTPLVIETKRKALKIGLSWGLGHLIGMLFLGILFLIFKEHIPIELISQFSEQLVAIVLISVDIWAFYRIFNKQKSHKHPHIHSENKPYIHIHKHEHSYGHHHTHQKVIKTRL